MAEVTVSQPGLGIRFPTFRKHFVMVDKVVTGIQLLFEREACWKPNEALPKVGR